MKKLFLKKKKSFHSPPLNSFAKNCLEDSRKSKKQPAQLTGAKKNISQKSKKTLQKTLKNRKIFHEVACTDIKGFQLHLNPDVDTNEKFREVISNYLLSIKATCFVLFGIIRYNISRNEAVGYGRCKHHFIHKNEFRFVLQGISDKEMSKLTISCTDKIYHDVKTPVTFKQLRGERRIKLKEILKHTKPKKAQLASVSTFDSNLAMETGNMQNFTKLSVLQKASSEQKSDGDYAICHIDDLLQTQIHQKGDFIRKVGAPLEVYMYSTDQMKLLKAGKYNAHGDASGELIKITDCHPNHMATKSLLLYSTVIQVGKEIVPVCEMISTNHHGVTIANFFAKFRHDAEVVNKVKWSPFKTFCTDWSMALIQGVCSGFNKMTVPQYLIYVYDVLTGQSKVKPDITTLSICVAHFMKAVANQCVLKIGKKTKGKTMVLNIFALLVNCSNLSTFDKLFESLCVICCSETVTDLTIKHYSILKDYCSDSEKDIELTLKSNDSDSDSDENLNPQFDTTAVYRSSPFFVGYNNIYEKVLNELTLHEKTKKRTYTFVQKLSYFL